MENDEIDKKQKQARDMKNMTQIKEMKQMRKTHITYITLMAFMISALVLQAFIAPLALAQSPLTITRSAAGAVAPGSTFEVRLTVDVPDEGKPRTYILVENIPEGFTIVDTDAKMRSDETGQMKWIVVEGLFGAKVEDAAYAYHLRAPETNGTYSFNGSAMLEDKKSVATTGSASIEVSETAINTETSSGINASDSRALGFGIVPYIIIAVMIIALISFILRPKMRPKTNSKGHISNAEGANNLSGAAFSTSSAGASLDRKGSKAKSAKSGSKGA